MDQAAIDEVAKTFMRARRTGERIDALPAHLSPKNFAESCAIMDAVDKLVGERIVGTKIAAKPGAEDRGSGAQNVRVRIFCRHHTP